jgi:uncharacterized protein (TIGR01777 family)
MPVVTITGGTGLIGKNLTTALIRKGYRVIILSRENSNNRSEENIKYASWDINKQQMDGFAISEADHIVHLAGAGVMDKRWTKKYKKEILSSRTRSSELLIKGLHENTNKVRSVISASAIGWYGKDHDLSQRKPFIESDPADKNFLGETCRLWEQSIEPASQVGKRVVKLRFGIVLSPKGGALEEFKKPLRFGVAAILGDGSQVISWIHIDDLCRMIIYAMENDKIKGSYNAVAPTPVSNKSFTLKLAKLVRKNFFIPIHVPQFLLKIILGEKSIEVLKSATVSADKIKNEGFTFLYPTIDAALGQLQIK